MLVRCRLVVSVAGSAREHGVVAGVGVAIGAGRPLSCMGTGIDRKLTVGKCGAGPRGRRMAGRTGRREGSGNVIRIAHVGVIGLVARIAGRRRSSILAADMTIRTSHVHVSPGERETRLRVVKRRGHPHTG